MAVKKQSGRKRYSTKRAAGAKKGKHSRLRRILFSILVVLVVGAAIFFLVLRGGQISIFENAAGSLLTPVQNAFSTATRSVKEFFTNWHNYGKLEEEYDALSMENEQLKMELVSAEEAIQENERLTSLLNAQSTYTSLDPVYAKVIARDAGPWFETFSLNRGSGSGVQVGMAVVNGDGLVGRVYQVGLNYSKVITIIDSRSRVACLMQRTRDNGIMYGQITDESSTAECYVYYLPNINSISPGDTVVTSGTDSLYPKGLKIGTVSALSLDAGSEGTYAIVTPSVDFQRIEEVFILRTVIETDTDEYLPSTDILNVEASYGATATPKASAKATPTPEPTQAPNYWSYPTVTPETGADPYNGYKVGNLIEDDWASASD
ncbi:MAG: rod shape-determining protein MreC [Clostridia bacterium]|nr:rod shape-determining protein MreC [Clostridia bacterium]